MSFGHCSGVAADGKSPGDVSQSRLSLRLGGVCAGGDFGLDGLGDGISKAAQCGLPAEGNDSFSRVGSFDDVFCALLAGSASLRTA